MARLLPSDLEIIGIFLYGPRWQTALARAMQCSGRLVRYWKAGRPLSRAASRRLEALVRNKHGEQMRRTRAFYLDMIASLSDTQIKGRLLTMDLTELQLDNQLRQRTLLETDLVLRLVAQSRADLERLTVAQLGSLCTLTYCALRAAVAPQPQRRARSSRPAATTPDAGPRAPPVHGQRQG